MADTTLATDRAVRLPRYADVRVLAPGEAVECVMLLALSAIASADILEYKPRMPAYRGVR